MIRYAITVVLFLACPQLGAQTFYGETLPIGATLGQPLNSRTFKLDVGICDSTEIYTCQPTHDTAQLQEKMYSDIAFDKYQNIWYVTSTGSLYKLQLMIQHQENT